MKLTEKYWLLKVVLEDIRGNWNWPLDRVNYALGLAKQLKLIKHIERLELAVEQIQRKDNSFDGRLFRGDWSLGGYNDMPYDKPKSFSVEFYEEVIKHMANPENLRYLIGDNL